MPAEQRPLRFTPKGRADLEAIWRYTAETWSPDQADRYIDDLASTMDRIAAFPEIARERMELSPPVRVHPTGPHVIIYRIETDHIAIIRVLGARQNWTTILKALDE